MAEEAKTTLYIDPKPALDALDRVRASIDGMQDDYASLNKSGDRLFDRAGASTQEFIGDVDDLAATMSKAQAAMQNLVRYERFLEAQQKKTTDPVLIRKYAAEIARTKKAMSELRATGVDTWERVGKAQSSSISLFGSLKGAIAGALPVLSLSTVAVGAIRAAGAYEQTVASFETFLKSASRAEKLLGELNAASIRTPFTNEQFEQGAKSLLAVNVAAQDVVPTLERIATISAATGKDFNELATIYAKARTAGTLYAEDINQLIDAGIPIIEEFAAILDTTPDKVKKLASQGKISFGVLEEATRRLTDEGGRYFGLLEKQSQTLPGLFSTLQGAFQNLLRSFGSGVIGDISKRLISNVTRLVNIINKQFTPAQKSLADQTRDVQTEFNNEIEVIKQGNFTQEQRANLIREINTKYGEYLPNLISEKSSLEDIAVAQAAANKQFEQKILYLAFEEEYQKAVEASKNAVQSALNAERQRVTLQRRFAQEGAQDNARLQEFQQGIVGFFEGTAEASAQAAEQAPEQLREIEDAFDTVAQRLGTTLDELRKKFAQPITTTTGAGGGVTDAEAKAIEAAETKRQNLRLSLIEDGRQKEIEAERIRFEALTAELNKYFAGREELDGLIEQATRQHRQNLLDINTRFDAVELNRIQQEEEKRQSLRLSLIEDGTQKEIEAERQRYEKIRSDLEKQFTDSAELPGLLEQAYAQHIANLNRINTDGVKAILEEEKSLYDQELQLAEAQFQKVILLMKQRGASEQEIAQAQAEFDLATQKKRLEAEIRFQEALLLATAGGDEQRRQAIEAQIALLNQQLENVNIKINAPTIEGGPKLDLKKLLGLDDESLKAVQEAASRAVQAIQQVTAARVQAAEEELRLSQEKVSQAEDALDREIQLAEEGFASNVTLKREELAEAKKQEQKALEDKQKAVRQQQAIETVTQTVNLISASAKIFNSLAAAGPVGIGLAIAAIASMFAAFAKVKIDAARATKFRHGGQGKMTDSGVAVGPSHSGGGIPIEIEGGEFLAGDGKRFAVVKKHLTAKHFDLLAAINRDDTPKIAELAAQIAGREQIYLRPKVGAAVESKRVEHTTARQVLELAELKKSNTLLQQNNAYLKKILDGKPETKYFNGGREERVPGLTKIIRDSGR